MSKPEKNPRVKSKTRAWEQGRRDRLAELFNKLWEALPNYDPSNKLSKPDILITAESTIRRLDAELKSVLITGPDKSGTKSSAATKEKAFSILIKKLEDRVKKLLLRNEQLSKCLSKAGIKAKAESGTVKRNKKPPKYANAISKEQQAQFLQKEMEKENQAKVQKPKVKNATAVKRKKVSEKPKIKKSKKKLLSSPNCVFLVTQAMTQNSSCFILSKPSSKISSTVITNSLLVKTPIVSSNIKPSIFPAYPQLPSLGPGTLLFANGTMMPIVPTPRPLPVLPTIVTNPIPSQVPTLVVVTSKDTTNSSVNTIVTSTKPCNTLPVLRPKLVNNTKTIQANKVPIPALTSKTVCRKAEVLDSQKRVSEATVQNDAKKIKTSKKIEKTNNESEKLDIEKSPDKNIQEVTQAQERNNKDSCEIPETSVEAPTSFCATNNNPCEDILKLKNTETSKIDRQEKTIDDSTKKANNYQLETFANVVTESHINPNNSVASSKPTDINSIFSETCVNSSISNDTNPKNETSHTQTQSFAKQKTFEHNATLQNDLKSLEMTELSNDIFASFQVAPGCQNPESTSPTAAFLLAFPLVSSGAKVTEVLGDENLESQAGTPNLLQIGTMDISKPTQNYSDSFTPNLLNFDSFTFNNCGNFYNNCSQQSTVTTTTKTYVNNSNINVNSSKNETLTNIQFNQNQISKTKTSINKTNSSITNKFPNYHTKEVPLNENLNKNIPVSLTQTNHHILHNNLDLNSDIFSFKPNNENFINSTKHSSTIKPYNNIPTYSTSTYKTCSSNQFMPNKNYPLVYTSASISNSFYSSFTTSDTVSGNFNSTNYNNYIQYGKTNHYNPNNSQTYQKNKFKATTQSKPINWMTSPAVTTSYKPDYFLPPFTNSSNAYCNEQQDFNRKTSEIFPTYRNDTDENQFSWSPNKIPQFLDTANHNNSFVSSTLPTLVGDLALNNTPSKEKNRKKSNCDNNQTSFLSVSQLVEQSQENVPAKIVSRRTSGNRSKTNTPKTNKRRLEATNKEIQQQNNFSISVATNLFNDNNKRNTSNNKNIPSSYSAEALIGNNLNPNNEKRSNSFCHQNKSLVPGFFNDNMVPYFPPVDTQQDNNSYMQSYQPTFQNNSYSANNFSTSSYNFMPNNQDFIGENNLFQNGNNKCNFTQKTNDKTQSYSCKKAKKRPLNDNVLPSFDIHFLSMPGAINSPILPDDFHTTYLPPTTLYSCKNPLYPKKTNTEGLSGSLIPPLPAISGNKPVHPQMSPLINSAGTSLTNFNLSTIFPEINKESNQFFPLKNGISNEKIEKTQNNYSSICAGQQYTT